MWMQFITLSSDFTVIFSVLDRILLVLSRVGPLRGIGGEEQAMFESSNGFSEHRSSNGGFNGQVCMSLEVKLATASLVPRADRLIDPATSTPAEILP